MGKVVFIFATMWMNLEDIMLSESQTEKGKYCLLSIIYRIHTENSQTHRNRGVFAKG